MKLAAIYNVFDGIELLPYSIKSIYEHVQSIIIVYQNTSNFGEKKDTLAEIQEHIGFNLSSKFHLLEYDPEQTIGAAAEIEKRNYGLEKAKNLGCSHFLFMDVDELYHDFAKAKKEFIVSGGDGSVCEMYTYFKNPTLRLAKIDNYFVPFIHILSPNTYAGCKQYQFYVDPTRKVNCHHIELINERMHHYSWVRKDINMKVRNSSAKSNILKSKLVEDYNNPLIGPGYYLKDYGQHLIKVENLFNIKIN